MNVEERREVNIHFHVSMIALSRDRFVVKNVMMHQIANLNAIQNLLNVD